MSDEFKNEFDEDRKQNLPQGEPEETSVNFTMRDAEEAEVQEASEQEKVKAAAQEEDKAEQLKREAAKKEEWYRKEQSSNYGSYRFTSPVPPEQPQKKKEKQAHSSSGMGRKLGMTAAIAAVFGLVGSVVFQATNFVGSKMFPEEKVKIENTQTINTETSALETKNTEIGQSSVSQVVENAMPSIVSIVGVSLQEIPDFYQYFGFGGGTQQSQEVQSSGSGIIVGQNETELLIATNNHVVAETDSLTVCFTNPDGSAVTGSNLENTSASSSEGGSSNDDGNSSTPDGAVAAQVKGTDANNDLAVISVKLSDIPDDILEEIKVAAIGDSDSLHMGDQVIAIGNALGYGQSVTSGYVSALNRQVSSENANSTFIQTDAAINPGNSGGALINMNGELVGINSAKIASNEVEGVGFAIPISRAEPILDELMNQKTRYKVDDESKASYIGITCKNVTTEASQMYNMPIGVYVDSLVEKGPAAEAGVQKGDIITKIDGTTVETYQNLVDRLLYYEAGEEIELVVSRAENGEYKEQTIKVTLGAKKDAQTEENSNPRQ